MPSLETVAPANPEALNAEVLSEREDKLEIAGIAEPKIWHYFNTLNAGDFQAASALFAPDGILHPPFEKPIQGQAAILKFLQAEAQGMQLRPEAGVVTEIESASLQVQVAGKVQTAWFGVNVSWQFELNQQRQITSATVRLLASPQELMQLRQP